MNKNQNGFSAIHGLLILVIVGIIGFTGWYVWQSNNKASDNLKNNSDNAEVAKKAATPKENANKGYAKIKEWGIKVKFRDADKVSFTYNSVGGTLPSGDQYESSATPTITPIDTKNESCKKVGLTIYRSKSQFSGDTKKVGDYYYHVTGSPSQCASDDLSNPDNLLHQRLVDDFTPDNVEVL